MNILISNHSDVPIYQQLIDCIKSEIINGHIKSGEALPSIRMMAKELSVSVITTKKAYEMLEQQGYIHTIAGKGSFVSEQSESLVREHKISAMEQHILSAVDISRELDWSKEEFIEFMDSLYEEA